MKPEEAACPQQSVDHVPVEASSSTTLLPGERASTVVPSAVANSLFCWVKTRGAFRIFFCYLLLQSPRTEASALREALVQSCTCQSGLCRFLTLKPSRRRLTQERIGGSA